MIRDIKQFEDLEAWQKAHELALKIYEITKFFPNEEIYGIISQMKRSSSSIGANIAEGFGRYHFADKNRFYYQARGSCTEIHNFLLLSKDLHFLSETQTNSIAKIVFETIKLLNGLIRATRERTNSNY